MTLIDVSVKKCLWTLLSIAMVPLLCIGIFYFVVGRIAYDERLSGLSEVDDLDEVL